MRDKELHSFAILWAASFDCLLINWTLTWPVPCRVQRHSCVKCSNLHGGWEEWSVIQWTGFLASLIIEQLIDSSMVVQIPSLMALVSASSGPHNAMLSDKTHRTQPRWSLVIAAIVTLSSPTANVDIDEQLLYRRSRPTVAFRVCPNALCGISTVIFCSF